jgi:hypothetical protein
MTPRIGIRRSVEPFQLREWYSSDEVKRRLGSICQAVNEQGRTVGLLGSDRHPLIILENADDVEPIAGEEEVTIDEARADWSSITYAVLFLGTTFRIMGKKRARAVLRRHPENRHPALKYRAALPSDLGRVVTAIEKLLEELRGVCLRLESATDVIDRRFRETWRATHGLNPWPMGTHIS